MDSAGAEGSVDFPLLLDPFTNPVMLMSIKTKYGKTDPNDAFGLYNFLYNKVFRSTFYLFYD